MISKVIREMETPQLYPWSELTQHTQKTTQRRLTNFLLFPLGDTYKLIYTYWNTRNNN